MFNISIAGSAPRWSTPFDNKESIVGRHHWSSMREKMLANSKFPAQRASRAESNLMGLLKDTQNYGLRMRRECRERFPRQRLQRKPLVSDPGMHHGTCVTYVSWCMSGSLTCGGGENVPVFPAHAQPAILRIWQEAHVMKYLWLHIASKHMPYSFSTHGTDHYSMQHLLHITRISIW